MKRRLNEGKVGRTAKRILGLAGLASLVLVCAGGGWAQSKPAQTEPTVARPVATAPATPPGVQSSSHTPVAKQVTAQNLPAKPSAQRGRAEGIKVHGRWVIDVKDPDGKVVSHRAFEELNFSRLA